MTQGMDIRDFDYEDDDEGMDEELGAERPNVRRDRKSIRGEKTAANTIYEDLRSELSSPVETELIWLAVAARPNIEVGYLPSMDFDVLRAFLKRQNRKDFDPLRFACQVISYMNRGVRFNGTQVIDEEGEDITFANMFEDRDAQEAISWVYGSDGAVIAVGQQLMTAAGYGGEGDGEDSPLAF